MRASTTRRARRASEEGRGRRRSPRVTARPGLCPAHRRRPPRRRRGEAREQLPGRSRAAPLAQHGRDLGRSASAGDQRAGARAPRVAARVSAAFVVRLRSSVNRSFVDRTSSPRRSARPAVRGARPCRADLARRARARPRVRAEHLDARHRLAPVQHVARGKRGRHGERSRSRRAARRAGGAPRRARAAGARTLFTVFNTVGTRRISPQSVRRLFTCSCATCPRSTSCSATRAPSRCAAPTRRARSSRGRVRRSAAGAEPGDLAERCAEELAARAAPRLRRALNATGVVVHTNLGRAPLADGGARARRRGRRRLLEPRVRPRRPARAARARITSPICSAGSPAPRPRSSSTTTPPRCCSRSPRSPRAARCSSRAAS